MAHERRRILVVDDDQTTREGIVFLLENEGFSAAQCGNGAEALALLRGGPPPAAILLDVSMPVMDGRELHAALQRDPLLAEIPIILVTGVGRGAIPIEVEAVIAKPFTKDRLLSVVRDVAPSGKGLCRILLVEDEADIRGALADTLRDYGYGVLEAADGADALSHLEAGWTPDLVVTDLMMPRITGWQLVEKMKERPELADVPIVVASGAANAAEAGLAIDGLVRKPIDERRLVSFVNRALARGRRRARTRSSARGDGVATTSTEQRAGTPDARARFFAAVAHELRSPLQALGFSTQALVKAESWGVREKRQALLARTSTMRMARLVEDLLDFMQADLTGLFRVTRQHCDVAGAVRAAVDELASAHVDRTIRLTAPERVEGYFDAERVGQIVTNLVQNALKYGSPTSPIEVSVGSDEDTALIQISNAGNQIPASAIPSLFDPFTRAAQGSNATPGLGLGLAIVRQIAFAHGGAVDVESSADRTTFSVVLAAKA